MPAPDNLTASPFLYRKSKPFSKAQFQFMRALSEYAMERLFAKLQARTAANPDANQYLEIHARLPADAVYLEAVLTHDSEWGGFGFDFARLYPLKEGRYNLAVRRMDDWIKAEHGTIESASVYFTQTLMAPRSTDWVKIAQRKTFEECIDLLVSEPTF